MIKSIHLKNYILIDDLTIDFSSGLNVITGETGAGKSILINATDIAFGAKSGVNLIKKGADKAIIEVFLSAENNNLKDLFEENGIDLFDEIVLTREITQNSSRTRVNGTLVNQQFLKEIKELLIDIHSQHQTYTFMQPKSHIKLLDSYAKDIYGNDLEEYKNLYFQYKEILNDLENAKNAANVTESQIDFLKFQINEIEEAEIKDIHEDEDLVKELSILENAEKLKELTSSAYWALNGEDNSILEAISKIKMNISKAVNLDSSLKDIESSLIELLELTRDTSNVLRDYSQSVSDDTERLNEVQERIFILDKMKHKYGNSLENVLENYNKFSEELSQIEFSTKNIDDLQNKSELIFEQMKKLASKISEQRKNCAEILSSLIVEELEKLELSKARFEIQIEDTDYSLTGKDEVEFYIATNVSQDLAPLSKTASGGEISRVMLAIKTIFANADNIDTVVFDEIDTGISGKAAQSVAEEIEELANYRQIIVITHQAIIAAKAKRHILVSKEQGENTLINIKMLNDDEKVTAIAKLAAGNDSASAVEFAKSLLNQN
jgi:DNA repair protein RecN (Recombination protein N)